MKKTIKFLSFVLCMTMLFTACGTKVALSKEQAVKQADRHLQCLLNKDYASVVADSDEKLQKQIDAAALQQAWESVVSTAGGFISATAITYESNNGVATVATTAATNTAALTATAAASTHLGQLPIVSLKLTGLLKQ